MISFVVFPAIYNTYVSFTNWSTGHILNKTQAIQVLEDRSFIPENQKDILFDLYVFQNEDLEFYFFADIDDNNLLFGKAVPDDKIFSSEYAKHEPSLKVNGELNIPNGFYLLTGKEQIANAEVLQNLSLVIDSSTKAHLNSS